MIPLPMALPVSTERMSGDEEQITFGLIYCHNQLNALAQQTFNAAAQLRAMMNVLQTHGLISEAELAEQREAQEKQLRDVFQQRKIGVRLSFATPDKYAVPAEEIPLIDCENRYHLCHGACCALRFPLTQQDLEEGVMRWDLAEPYLNRQGPDRLCVHQDRETHRCSIYEHRPGICRIYDCREDNRIWQDFEKGIINPDLFVVDEDGRRHIQFLEPRVAPEADEEAGRMDRTPAPVEQPA